MVVLKREKKNQFHAYFSLVPDKEIYGLRNLNVLMTLNDRAVLEEDWVIF